MGVRSLAVLTLIGSLAVVATVWRNAPAGTPTAAAAAAGPAPATGNSSSASSESPEIRCEFEGVTDAELKAMESGVGSPGEAAARARCIAHEAYKYELEIDSTITGGTMRGKNNTVGRISLIWYYGSRPKEGHWEGVGVLVSNTIPLGAATCPPAIATVDGFGTYDFQARWVQISHANPSEIEVWIDAGPADERFDILRIPPCLGGGISHTNFWENQFFLTHFRDRGVHGLQIRDWTGLVPGGSATNGLLAMAITPETCQGMCNGLTKFNLHMTRLSRQP